MKLTVQKLGASETFNDMVRIPKKYRGGVKEGRMCKLSTRVASKIVQVKGKDDTHPAIYMDLRTRSEFGLGVGDVADFDIEPVGWIGQLIWASRHANPALRIAAQLGLISVILGALSIALALATLLR